MIKRLFILFFLSFAAISMQNQPDLNSKVRALYIYNFTNMVDWPKDQKSGSFNIGVFGETNLFNELNTKYSGKSVGSQKIVISQYKSQTEITTCHILFITKEHSSKTSELAKKYKAKSTLIVTEKEGALKDGSVINFIIRNNRQSYEISKTNATKHKLTLGKQLTELAVKVE